jgi:hypothetical protein
VQGILPLVFIVAIPAKALMTDKERSNNADRFAADVFDAREMLRSVINPVPSKTVIPEKGREKQCSSCPNSSGNQRL